MNHPVLHLQKPCKLNLSRHITRLYMHRNVPTYVTTQNGIRTHDSSDQVIQGRVFCSCKNARLVPGCTLRKIQANNPD